MRLCASAKPQAGILVGVLLVWCAGARAEEAANARPPKDDADLRYWLGNLQIQLITLLHYVY